jgi:7,8-dihydropterin-6-yl-methyl-4-(beta-D-ribofuranosyl)aminobenzene 5'-phosphate synthase
MSEANNFEIKIVFDNNCLEGFKKGWGFGAIILNNHSKNTILFDTGANFTRLAHNINQSNIKLEDISKVIISHDHPDHSGGLLKLLDKNPNVVVYVADSNEETYKRIVPSGVEVVGIKNMIEIDKDFFLSNELKSEDRDPIPEICVFLKTDDGIIVITGCAHPDMGHFVEDAKKLGKVKAVLGGFHRSRMLDSLEGVDLIAPCHCTQRVEKIKKMYPDSFIEIKAGSELSF